MRGKEFSSTTKFILGSIGSRDHVFVHTNVQLWDVHIVETIEIALRARDQGAKVTVLSCSGGLSSCPANALNRELLCELCNSKTAPLVTFLQSHQVETLSVPDFRMEVEESTELARIRSQRDLKLFHDSGAPIGRLVASQIADDEKDVYFEMEGAIRDRAQWHCANASALFKWTTQILQEREATKVFVWNGRRPSDGPVYYAAKALGLPAYTYLSGGRPGKLFITSAPSLQEVPPGEVADDIRAMSHEFFDPVKEGKERLGDYRAGTTQRVGFKHYGPPPQNSSVTVSPPENVQRWLRGTKIRVFLPTSSPSEILHIEEVDRQFKDDPYGWIERLQARLSLDDFDLLVRWHPRQRAAGLGETGRIRRIAEAAPTNVTHILPAEDVDSYLLAAEADVVVATGSTLALWAATIRQPVIHFDQRIHFLDGAWTRVGDENALPHAIANARPSAPDAALLWALYRAERGEKMSFIEWHDGKPRVPYSRKFSAKAFRIMVVMAAARLSTRISQRFNRT